MKKKHFAALIFSKKYEEDYKKIGMEKIV